MTEVSTSAQGQQGQAPYVVPKAPETQTITDVACVEWDHTGRVISSRFAGGHQSQFRYDAGGSLYGFSYARMAWSTQDGLNWTARDYANDYAMFGRVDVGMDGCISIQKSGLTRTLKLNGMIADKHADNTVSESVRGTAEPTPGDLMATCTPRASTREPVVLDKNPVRPKQITAPVSKVTAEVAAQALAASNEDDKPTVPMRKVTVWRQKPAGVPPTTKSDRFNSDLAATSYPNLEEANEPEVKPEMRPTANTGAPLISFDGAVSDAMKANSMPSGVAAFEIVEEPIVAPSMSRKMTVEHLRLAQDVAQARTEHSGDFANDTRSFLDEFVTTSLIRLLELAKGLDAPELPKFLDKLAAICQRENRVDEARTLHERALSIRVRHLGVDHADTSVNLHGLGRIYLEWGRQVEAEQFLLDTVKVCDKGLRKAKFLCSTDAVEPSVLTAALTSLIDGLHSLSSLYHEQKKMHLCVQLHETAVSATNSVPRELRANIDAGLESLAAMACHAEMPVRKFIRAKV